MLGLKQNQWDEMVATVAAPVLAPKLVRALEREPSALFSDSTHLPSALELFVREGNSHW